MSIRRTLLLEEKDGGSRIATGLGWQPFTDNAYDGNEIDRIEDNAGANIKRRITSYPTPLARVHFFDDAFEYIYSQNQENGDTIFHEAVSHCLDIWEILFNYEVFKNDLSISEWDFDKISTLMKSVNEGHQLLGRSLDLYLRQDKSIQLDATFDKFYLIKYKNILIGGSSPFTGFFTIEFEKDDTGNSILPHGLEITVPGKPALKYFSTRRGISERAASFQAYLMLLFRSHTNLSRYFKHFHNYIDRYTHKTNEINAIVNSTPNHLLLEYLPKQDVSWSLDGVAKKIELLNNTLMYPPTDVIHPSGTTTIGPQQGIVIKKQELELPDSCQFVIASNANKPNTDRVLALCERPSGNAKVYVDFLWDNDIKVKHHYSEVYTDRLLPSWNIKHPFLVLSDFLEEYLIEVPYNINDDSFYTFTDGDSRFLIPIKPLYFKFFDISDLNKTSFKINITGEGLDKKVRINLDIPLVNSNGITFSREYQYDSQFRTYENIWASLQGKGAIIKYEVGILIFPFLRTSNDAYNDFYKVACIDGELNVKEAAELSFYEQDVQSEIPIANARLTKKERVPKRFGSSVGSTYYELIGNNGHRGDFDYLQVKFSLNRDKQNTAIYGLVIPKWDSVNLDGGPFTFAVDFGTTNSHIAYKKGGINSMSAPDSFKSLDSKNLLVQRLDKVTSETAFAALSENYDSKSRSDENFIDYLVRVQREEFIPSVFGGLYAFPFRTAVAQAVTHSVGAGGFNLFGNTNIAFSLNRRVQGDRSNPTFEIFSDLKWSNDANTRERVKIFIQEVLYLIRAKVILAKGNPSVTNLYWFTPLNMSPSIYQNLQNTWTAEFQRIFHTTNRPISLSESEAPYYAINVGAHEVMTIDIGGMTTDMLYIEGKKPILGSSFSFAGNAIYGDFPSDTITREANGFVKAFREPIKKRLVTLTNNTQDNYQKTLYEEAKMTLESYLAENGMRSDDIVSLFYSNPSFGFTDLLRNSNDFKIIFLLQYAGILYHCAKLVAHTDNASPGEIIFSGNGSKMFTIISNQNDALNKIANKIFSHITENDKEIVVHTDTGMMGPKEASCIGALKSGLQAAKKPNSELKSIIVGENINWKGEVPTKPSYTDIEKARNNFSAVDSEYYKFVDLFLKIYQDLNLADTYGIQINLARLEETLKNDKDTADYHYQGLQWTIRKGAVQGDPIIETVFFYPLIGAINKLSNRLADKDL
jgi:hypothetical protein